MRKLLSGYLFRFLKSYELWVLIALYVAATAFLVFEFANSKSYITMTRSNDTLQWGENGEIILSKDNIKDYMFESIGVSELSLYRFYVGPVPKEDYDAIKNSVAIGEREIFCGLIEFLHVVPTVIVLILIPDFFGTMFKDRTIKNLISCGHSKGMIYLSSLVFSFLLNLAMIFVSIFIYALLCLFYMWKAPIFLPAILVMLLVEIFITFTFSSICLAFVFISGKRIVAFIASFLMIWTVIGVYIGKYDGTVSDTISKLYFEVNIYEEYADADGDEHIDIGVYDLEDRFDVFEFRSKTYYKGNELKVSGEGHVDPVQKFARMAIIYMDPLLVQRFESFGLETYTCFCDGLMAIELANNVFWILAGTAIGIAIFKKREVHG